MSSIYKLLLEKMVHKVCFLVIIIIASINSFVFSKIILLSGEIINIYLNKSSSSINSTVHNLILFSVLWFTLNVVYYIFTNYSIEKRLAGIRNSLADFILNGDMSILEKSVHSGNFTIRANSDIEKLSYILSGDFLWFLRVFMNAFFALINCIIIDYRLSLVFVIFPISFFIIKRLSKPIRKRKKESAKCIDNAITLMLEALQGLTILKSFNLEKKVIFKFNESMEKAKAENIKNEKTSLLNVAINYIIQIIQLSILLLVGIFMIYNGNILPGTFISILLLSNNIRFAVRLLSDITLCFHESAVLSERILEIFNIQSEKKGKGNIMPSKLNSIDCLNIENLSFKYDNQNILNDVSLKISQGEKIAILGQSGCGKSTLVKLICGFYENYKGNINIYQNNIKNISKNSIRQQISIITQEPLIINDSIYENIVLYRKNISMNTIADVIEKCCLEDLIKSLPDGLNTIIGDGGMNLSQGEKQRISIARAIIKNSPIVIMDEATASLDYTTEESILSSFDYLLNGKTAIIITHKPNILKLTDRKYTMQNGKLILI